jgi:tRNA A-37 threonylcarbamoyl transferase component Bud32
MGTVYLGRQQQAKGETVAIKVMHPALAADQEMVASFIDEARLASRIQHPNVVAVLDVDLFGDDLVLVLEYVRGTSMQNVLRAMNRAQRRLPVGIALRIVRDVLAGLHASHELTDEAGLPLNVVHRDVSPHNVLVGIDGVSKLTDFGVAHAAGRLAQTRVNDKAVKGKLGYLAPEQLHKKPIDRRVDVFAAGIVLWEALTGETLFPGATEAETLGLLLRRPIPPPSSIAPDVSIELDEACLRALERDPRRRFATVDEFDRMLADAATPASHAEVGAMVASVAAETLEQHDEALRAPAFDLERGVRGSLSPAASPLGRPGAIAAAIALFTLAAGVTWASLHRREHPVVRPQPRAEATASEAPPVASAAPAPSEILEFVEVPSREPRAASGTKARRDAGAKSQHGTKQPPAKGGQFMPSDL